MTWHGQKKRDANGYRNITVPKTHPAIPAINKTDINGTTIKLMKIEKIGNE